MALALSRNAGESIRIGEDITVQVVSSRDGKVKLAVTAPKETSIWREEIWRKIKNANDAAAQPILKSRAGPTPYDRSKDPHAAAWDAHVAAGGD